MGEIVFRRILPRKAVLAETNYGSFLFLPGPILGKKYKGNQFFHLCYWKAILVDFYRHSSLLTIFLASCFPWTGKWNLAITKLRANMRIQYEKKWMPRLTLLRAYPSLLRYFHFTKTLIYSHIGYKFKCKKGCLWRWWNTGAFAFKPNSYRSRDDFAGKHLKKFDEKTFSHLNVTVENSLFSLI